MFFLCSNTIEHLNVGINNFTWRNMTFHNNKKTLKHLRLALFGVALGSVVSEILLLLTRNDTVRVIFCLWAIQLTKVVRRVPHFGAGIVWGTIPSGFPVFWFIVPGCSRNGYGTSPNLSFQKKLVKLWQGTQDAWLCSAKFFWEFLVTLPSISSET